jgi:hypothetical protein
MGTTITLILAVLALAFISSKIKLKDIKTPESIEKLRASTSWDILFFNSKPWLKEILIMLLKFISFMACSLLKLITLGFKLGWRMIPKKFKA